MRERPLVLPSVVVKVRELPLVLPICGGQGERATPCPPICGGQGQRATPCPPICGGQGQRATPCPPHLWWSRSESDPLSSPSVVVKVRELPLVKVRELPLVLPICGGQGERATPCQGQRATPCPPHLWWSRSESYPVSSPSVVVKVRERPLVLPICGGQGERATPCQGQRATPCPPHLWWSR